MSAKMLATAQIRRSCKVARNKEKFHASVGNVAIARAHGKYIPEIENHFQGKVLTSY